MVACDEVHSLAVTSAGKVYAWGCASYGRLGVGSVDEMVADVNGDFYQPSPRWVQGLNYYHIWTPNPRFYSSTRGGCKDSKDNTSN